MSLYNLPTNKGARQIMRAMSNQFDIDICTKRLDYVKNRIFLKDIVDKCASTSSTEHALYGKINITKINEYGRTAIKKLIKDLDDKSITFNDFNMIQHDRSGHCSSDSKNVRTANLIETLVNHIKKMSKKNINLKYSSQGLPFIEIAEIVDTNRQIEYLKGDKIND